MEQLRELEAIAEEAYDIIYDSSRAHVYYSLAKDTLNEERSPSSPVLKGA